jgi:hypothetical protein
MYAHSLQGKKGFTLFHTSEFNLKLHLNYCNPEIREKEDNLIFRIKTRTIPMVVTIEYKKKKLPELLSIRHSYVKH